MSAAEVFLRPERAAVEWNGLARGDAVTIYGDGCEVTLDVPAGLGLPVATAINVAVGAQTTPAAVPTRADMLEALCALADFHGDDVPPWSPAAKAIAMANALRWRPR